MEETPAGIRNPTLVFDAAAGMLVDPAASRCCNAPIDSDGDCTACELNAPVPHPLVCSDCRTPICDITPKDQPLLECGSCGARWAGIAPHAEPSTVDGLEANGWDPALAPIRFTTYLQSFDDRAAA